MAFYTLAYNFLGNLQSLFEKYPILDKHLSQLVDNGPSVEITFVKGDLTAAHNQYGPTGVIETDSGYAEVTKYMVFLFYNVTYRVLIIVV